MDSITVTPRWVEQSTGMHSLVLGRMALVHLSREPGARWCGTRLYVAYGEDGVFWAADESAARALAEAHARRVLGDA